MATEVIGNDRKTVDAILTELELTGRSDESITTKHLRCTAAISAVADDVADAIEDAQAAQTGAEAAQTAAEAAQAAAETAQTAAEAATATKADIASPTFTGTVTVPALKGTVQALTAAGAVNLTSLVTTVASSEAIALTLADGAAGQVKVISMITDGGDATLTPAHLQGGTTLTFNDVGDTVTLLFVGTKWAIIANTGATLA